MKTFSSKKLLWISGILFLLSQSVILMILFPTSGSEILNHQTTFSPDEFQAILNHWGPEGIQRFLAHYYLDFFHPFLYFVFLACCLSWAWSKNNFSWLLLLPLFAALGDDVENLCQLPITLGWLPVNSVWFYIGATSSRMKWLFVGITLAVIFVGLVRKLISKK